ncbi:MAG: response regulator transcription factor [Flavobacteriales bacterium]|nr:response regulator transcription factor [Flavobacteriales bacterium]
MIRCNIIDDDKVFTKILEHYISTVSYLSHQETYHDSSLAFNKININDTDLIFLDMEIPQMHGLDFLKALSNKPAIVFVSKSKTYGPEAFEYNAIDYLHKPISLNRFLNCANKIRSHFEMKMPTTENDSIFIRNEGVWLKISTENILYIKADNNHVIIKTDENKYRTNEKLKDIAEKLSKNDFMQIHRSYIVQLNKISRIDGEVLEINTKTLPISRTYLNKLYNRLNLT